MWMATQHGFFSIVKNRFDESGRTFFIRARVKQDLINVVEMMKWEQHLTVEEWPQADYTFRVIVNEPQLVLFVVKVAKAIDYSNFKSRIDEIEDQRAKHGAYLQVWSALLRLQPARALSLFSRVENDHSHLCPECQGQWRCTINGCDLEPGTPEACDECCGYADGAQLVDDEADRDGGAYLRGWSDTGFDDGGDEDEAEGGAVAVEGFEVDASLVKQSWTFMVLEDATEEAAAGRVA